MKRYVTLFWVIATIAMNGLANALPINGQQTGEISDRFEVFFTPAGYVFSIWGLIYLGLVLFAFYQLLPKQEDNQLIERISVSFWISSIANIAWILLWHYEYFASTLIVIIVLLVSLVWIWLVLSSAGLPKDQAEHWMLRIPFSVYVGWVSIATLANLAVVLEEKGLRPFDIGARDWAIGMIVLGGLTALAVGHFRRDLAYLAVFLWAFTGIAFKQDWNGAVAITALVFSAGMVLQCLWILLRNRELRALTAAV